MTVAAELGLSEVGLEQIDCIVAGSVPLSAPGDDPPMSAVVIAEADESNPIRRFHNRAVRN